MQYFGSNIVESVAESWVEAEMRWVEVDGAGWRWVYSLVIPIADQFFKHFVKLSISTIFKDIQKQPPEMFYKKGVLKNFPRITGKHCAKVYFLIQA